MDAATPDQPRTERIRLGSGAAAGKFAYLDYGAADRPVDAVFLHANGYNARAYRSILSPLAADFRLLALDLRGHGRTTARAEPEGRTTWLDMAEDLKAFLAALDLGRVVLGGHSMGGTLSLFASAALPQRVRGLCLFDPVIRRWGAASMDAAIESPLVAGASRRRRAFDSREAAVAAYRGRGGFTNWTETMLVDYVEDGFRDTADGTVTLACTPEWEVSNYLAQAHDAWAAFEASRCPISILRAERASTCMVDDRIAALTASGRIRIETVPGTTHFLPMERPDLVRSTLREALERKVS